MRIVVLYGGISPERDISVKSGTRVADALSTRGHVVAGILITGEGRFVLQREPATGPTSAGRGPWSAAEFLSFLEGWRPDVVFLGLHGRGGEDGAIQGFLEWSGIPYTGSSVGPSALAMDKTAFKAVLVELGAPTAPHVTLTRDEWVDDRRSALGRGCVVAGLPGVIKLPASGSSIGVWIVHDSKTCEEYLDRAFREETRVLWEAYRPGRELTAAVLDDPETGQPVPLPVVEIRPRGEFFDLDSKYAPGGAEELAPAPIAAEIAGELQEWAVRIHRRIDGRGYSRTDAMLTDDGLVILETNTLPGLTEGSLLPKAAAAAGIEFDDLVERIALAASRTPADASARPREFHAGS
ncbi:MAG TPA: D-alanine--D-alanine ligase [Planctomycetes bacterium]|nr:D-alanine--D-alanine ligase [Planctomycetota bacterium]